MKILGILLAVIVVGIVAYQLAYPSVTIRYRLTLNAEVDGVPKIGSGVIEVSYGKNPQILGASAELKINVHGEAVALDLGSRGILFALLKAGEDSRSSAEWIVLRAFDLPGGAFPSPVEKGVKEVGQLSGKVDLSVKSLPLLVRFRDINDPMTIEKVDPFNLEASFGAGVKLTGASIEIVSAGVWPLSYFGLVDQPITSDLTRRLPWLTGMVTNIDGTSFTSSTNLSNALNSSDFQRM